MSDQKLTALTEISVPALEDLLYTVDDPSGTPVSNKLTAARAIGNWFPHLCQLRLTTQSGVPVSTSDRTSQSTIYLTPAGGKGISLYDGTRWKAIQTPEISLALSGLTSGKNYWVYAYDNAGTVTLELGAAWTDDITSADTITTQDGVQVKSGTTTRRVVGLIRTTSTTTTEDSVSKRFVWSAFNQVARQLRRVEATDNWAYTTATIRQANASSSNKVEYITGDASMLVDARLVVNVGVVANTTRNAEVGIGVDSTSTFSGLVASLLSQAAIDVTIAGVPASYRGLPGVGYHYLSWNEFGSDGTCFFYGDAGEVGGQQSGLDAVIWA